MLWTGYNLAMVLQSALTRFPGRPAKDRVPKPGGGNVEDFVSNGRFGPRGGRDAAQADKLDDIIASGKLRCAVVLDFPPMGSRDEKNQPIGYDVDTCNDLAAALGVKPEMSRRRSRIASRR